MSERDHTEAFVTLATNDTYSLGCLVLGASLRNVGTKKQLAVMVTTGVSNTMRSQLAQVFDLIQEVNVLDSKDPVNLALLGRPDLNVTFTKLHCWRLTKYTKAVFLDADTLVLQNIDELLDREEFSAAPDAGWPDCFNSGVFVFKPSIDTYQTLLAFATSHGSFDGGDQGLLNMYFSNWATADIAKHLPFVYNVVSQAFYSYLPAFTQFKDRVRIVHFIGAVKPWHHTYDTSTGKVTPLPGTGHSQEFLQVWWNTFMQKVQPSLDPALTEQFSQLTENLSFQSDKSSVNIPPMWDTVFTQHHSTSDTFVKFPFTPPEVGEVFYDAVDTLESNTDTKETLENRLLIEKSLMPRSYTELESHYTEAPLSHIDPDSPPDTVYEAPQVTKCWEMGAVKKVSATTVVSAAEPPPTTVDTPDKMLLSGCDGCGEESTETEMGLAGQLATMSVSTPGGPMHQLTDQERKLNWEKGQIDYLGTDSFENIQKKIEDSLKAEASAETTPASSPAESKPSESPSPTTTILSVKTSSSVKK